MTPDFLSLDEVLSLHEEQIRLFGGSGGVHDIGLLDTALALPSATVGGEYLHPALHEMAAAYSSTSCRTIRSSMGTSGRVSTRRSCSWS